MSALAKELGVGRATLYRWGGNREELLGAVLAEATERTFRAAVREVDARFADGDAGAPVGGDRVLVRMADGPLYADLLGGGEPGIAETVTLVALEERGLTRRRWRDQIRICLSSDAVVEKGAVMATVETVRGPVELDSLGPTLMHEHVFVMSTEHMQNYGSSWWDEEARVADAVVKLNRLHAKGVTTIVDPTVWGLGRYIPRIQRIAEQTPVNIVVATGLYAYEELPHHYSYRGPGGLLDVPEPLVTDFVGDIVDGIAGTGVKAAFLKCCIEAAGLTPGVERIARAVARTSVETGVPITVHTSGPAATGRLAVELFAEEGVDLTKVVIGHAGDSNDLDYLTEIADRGVTLGMDRFGLDIFNPGSQRIATVAALAARGYADRMVLAHDASCFIDYFGAAHDQVLAASAPNWHYEHISDDVLPALLAAGVTQKQIDQMMIDNPVRYFAGKS